MPGMSTNLVRPLTTRQAADRLGVSVWTIHGLVRNGKLAPLYKLEGTTGAYAFDPADVERIATEVAS